MSIYVLLVFIAELSALLIAFSLPYFGVSNNNRLFIEYRKKFHPLFVKKPLRIPRNKAKGREYDPWFGYRNTRYFVGKGIHRVDKMGFISNGDSSRDISKKSPGTYRIFILGGSTVVGGSTVLGGRDNSITVELERMLNSSPVLGKARPHFQVVNAGVSGWYSPQEVALAQFEILSYQPDIIITFDGLNDMLHASQMEQEAIERYHWHEYQKYLKEQLDNPKLSLGLFKDALASSKYNPARYFYSLNLAFYRLPRLIKKFLRNRENKERKTVLKKIANKLMLRNQNLIVPRWCWKHIMQIENWAETDFIDSFPAAPNVFFVDRYIRNLRNLSAICEANDIQYMALLQPILVPEFKASFSDREKFLYYCETQLFFNFQPPKKNYRLSVLNYYTKCIELGKKYLGGVFFDCSKMFYSEKDELYQDWWHYNKKGNKLIALTMKNLIEKSLKQKYSDSKN